MRLHAPSAARPVGAADKSVTQVTRPDDDTSGSRSSYDYEAASRVRIPAHIWRHPDLTAADKVVWPKIAKLDKPGPGRPGGGCVLPIIELARQLNLAPGTVKASLRKLDRLKLMHSRERVTKFGRQASVRFALRQGDIDGPLFADVPVGLVDELRGHELPLLCELMMRLHTGRLIDTSALAESIGISPGAVTQYLVRLAARGLVEVVQRGGRQGRHQYKARWSTDDPFMISEPGPSIMENRPWGAQQNQPSATPENRPAYGKQSVEEDSEVDPPLRSVEDAEVADAREHADGGAHETAPPEPASPAVPPLPTSGLRPERKSAATSKRGGRSRPKAAARPRPDRHQLKAVREIVVPHAGADLLAQLSAWQRRELEARLARWLDENRDTPVPRMAYRLRNALNRTSGADVEDAFPWLFTAATRRQGCADPMCEDGLIWDLRTACRACAERKLERAGAKRAAQIQAGGEVCPEPAPAGSFEQAPAASRPPVRLEPSAASNGSAGAAAFRAALAASQTARNDMRAKIHGRESAGRPVSGR
jgi:DNA-binding transcriptional ArsR family regulator